MSPLRLHRLAAFLEMITWSLLIIGMILKYSGTSEAFVPIGGGIHGFGFLCFLVITVIVWVNNRWSLRLGLCGLIVSVIPFAALPFTIWADRKGYLHGGWRFQDPAEKPTTFADHLLAQVIRHPVRSVLLIVVLVIIVFIALLNMGPPYDPDAIAGTVS